MINALLGKPGGGKSYEAVVFHLLVAVQEGRKVITNLPIFIDQIAAIEPQARGLVEHRTTHRSGKGLPFSTVDEYGDAWRHPDSGIGALYIIDEAHKVLPRRDTPRAVAEWYAEHRHELCDVLLVTQAYGKLDPDVRDLIQVVYRVVKKTAFGDSKSYIRKVQDGLRGEVMSTVERQYQSRYFKLYKSHTRSVASAMEADAVDMPTPTFMKWRRAAGAFGLVGVAALGLVAWNAFHKPSAVPSRASGAVRAAPVASVPPKQPVVLPASASGAVPRDVSGPKSTGPHPFKGMGIHLGGGIVSGGRFDYYFIISQNGQPTMTQRRQDMEAAGYGVEFVNECVAKLTHENVAEPFYVRCDLPQTAIMAKRDT